MATPSVGKDPGRKKYIPLAGFPPANSTESNLTPSIFDHIPAGILRADAQGNIETCNQMLGQIYECTQDELIGKNLGLLIPPEQHGSQQSVLQTVLEKGSYVSEISVRTQSGSDVYLLVSLNRSPDCGSGM